MNVKPIRWIALIFAAWTGIAAADQAAVVRPKNIGVLLFDKVLTSDVTAPLEVFGKAVAGPALRGYRVVTVAPEGKPIRTEEGVKLVPDFGLADAPPLDVLIVGSAYKMEPLLADKKLMQWIAVRGKSAKWLASNCSGARLLGEAGLLVGRRATTYPGGELIMKVRFPRTSIVFGQEVVVDGNLVTSNGGLVSYKAALELLAAMTTREAARSVAAAIYYDRLTDDETN